MTENGSGTKKPKKSRAATTASARTAKPAAKATAGAAASSGTRSRAPKARTTAVVETTGGRTTEIDRTTGEAPSESRDRLARALGWFSVGLGVPQVVAPGALNRLVGIADDTRHRAVMRAVGLRELAGGAGILSRSRPSGYLFARVAGDAMDLVMLRSAIPKMGAARRRVTTAAAAVAGVAVLDVIATARTRRSADPDTPPGAVRAHTTITIRKPADELYRFWRNFQNLPRFMWHLESVQANSDGTSHWLAKGPAGMSVEWDAEITEDVVGERIAWRSTETSDVTTTGAVTFTPAPGDRGTEVTVDITYQPPGGALGAAVARLFGEDPQQQIKDDLRRFKQVMETGDVVRSDGTPDGTRTQRQFRQRPAQPLD